MLGVFQCFPFEIKNESDLSIELPGKQLRYIIKGIAKEYMFSNYDSSKYHTIISNDCLVWDNICIIS